MQYIHIFQYISVESEFLPYPDGVCEFIFLSCQMFALNNYSLTCLV